MELPKAYEPANYENEIYEKWLESGFFNPDVCVQKGVAKNDAPVFSMVLPPPNVTGVLHMGHASMLAIEDVMTRFNRMKGNRTLWLPGTDHASIATQTKVEKLLMEKGIKDPRKEMGREKFLNEVNNFAKASHDTIINQCKKMGASLDWSREAFTLDEKRNLAVRTVFKKMYDDGLIERGHRIVNWCPRCHSTLADDEVEYKDQSAKIFTFKYSVDFPFSISTTRPETKLGDTAVAVNPKDKRYKKYIGQTFEIKTFAGGSDLKIQIIGDEAVDMDYGTGAVGVTPAHSHVDYEIAQKNNLPVIKIIDENGKMTSEAGSAYSGLTAKEARKKVVEYLRINNLLIEEKDAPNNLSVCYRCEAPIEPLPSRQWFIKVNKEFVITSSKIKGIKSGQKTTLKKLMQQSIKGGQIKIIPDRFEKTYFHWIDNLHDWCVSRQIWYGHQLPVWYREEEIFVGLDAPEDEGWQQDPDTLDTWFSSGIWTFSTLGYPNLDDEDFINYHPTSMLETGYDIIFFWVARMILMTNYVLGDIPFETVYLHGLVRDEQGRKMSKTLGNVINPLDMIAKYGADATRLSLLVGNTPGNDLKLSEEKIAGFRNFTNKLWNISRFMLLNVTDPKIDIKEPKANTLADEWILERLHKIIDLTTKNIEQNNFSYAGEQLRDFTWSDLADWYLEVAKVEGEKSKILNYILNTVIKLWHPFMPFVTEVVWREIYGGAQMLMVEFWPVSVIARNKATPARTAEVIQSGGKKSLDFEIIKNIITNIRSLRAEYKVEPVKKIPASISAENKIDLIKENASVIKSLARIENLNIEIKADRPTGSVGFVESGVDVFIDLSGLVDFDKEKIRIKNEIDELVPYFKNLEKKLSNKEFAKNAPKAIIEKEKEKYVQAKEKIEKLSNQLQNIK